MKPRLPTMDELSAITGVSANAIGANVELLKAMLEKREPKLWARWDREAIRARRLHKKHEESKPGEKEGRRAPPRRIAHGSEREHRPAHA